MNELKRIADFRTALQNYVPSAAARKTLSETPIALLAGPSGSGRNTIITELLKTGHYYHIVSDTTREMRTKDGAPIEQNGREYWFRKEDDVLAEVQKGEFVEAAIIHEQQVSGMSIREIEQAHKAHRIAVTDVTPGGVASVHALKPDAAVIFVLPPSFDVWMARLHNRGNLPEDELHRRLESAHREIVAALTNDYYAFVVNLDLLQAVENIDAIVRLHRRNAAKQHEARELAEQLRRDVAAYLKPKNDIFQ